MRLERQEEDGSSTRHAVVHVGDQNGVSGLWLQTCMLQSCGGKRRGLEMLCVVFSNLLLIDY